MFLQNISPPEGTVPVLVHSALGILIGSWWFMFSELSLQARQR